MFEKTKKRLYNGSKEVDKMKQENISFYIGELLDNGKISEDDLDDYDKVWCRLQNEYADEMTRHHISKKDVILNLFPLQDSDIYEDY